MAGDLYKISPVEGSLKAYLVRRRIERFSEEALRFIVQGEYTMGLFVLNNLMFLKGKEETGEACKKKLLRAFWGEIGRSFERRIETLRESRTRLEDSAELVHEKALLEFLLRKFDIVFEQDTLVQIGRTLERARPHVAAMICGDISITPKTMEKIGGILYGKIQW